MSAGAAATPGLQPPPGQDQQDPLAPPSIKRSLLSAIPIIGPILGAHSLYQLELKRRREDQQIQAKAEPYKLASQFSQDQNIDPDTRLQWQQLQADMAIHNEESPTKPYAPDLIKRHQSLLGQTNAQVAQRNLQSGQSIPAAMQPPQPGGDQNAGDFSGLFKIPPPPGAATGMLPQGSSQVSTAPGRPPVQPQPMSLQQPMTLQPPQGMQPPAQPPQDANDPMASLTALSQSPNPLERGPALNALRAIQMNQESSAARIATVHQQLRANNIDPATLPAEAWMDLLAGKDIRPLNPLKPGEVQPSVSGRIIAQNPLPRMENVPEGAQPIFMTPPPLAGQVAAPSAPTMQAGAPGSALPSGVQMGAATPPKLSTEEADAIAAARQLSAKYKFPFDENKNPRNPQAQIPTQYLNEFQGMKAIQKADPQMRALMMQSKNLSDMLMQMQLQNMPTKDQAEDAAKMLLDHRMSPSQLTTMFGGFGAQGQAAKRMVVQAVNRMDPTYNWEEAESEYGLVKSPSFQNTIRYMDSTMESIPMLLDRAKALSNTGVRSLNKLVTAGKSELNNVDIKKFKTDVTFVGDEIAKLLQGGGSGSGTSDAKLKQAQDIFNTSDNPKEIAAAVEDVQQLLGYRRKALTRGTYMERRTLTPPPGSSQIPEIKPTDTAAYNALPKGAKYTQNGTTHTKR